MSKKTQQVEGKEGPTPGPWGIEGAINIWIKAGSLHIATIPRCSDGDWSEANARLIAAAPELRDAAKEAADAIHARIGIELAKTGDIWLATAFRGLKAALAKAGVTL